MRIVFLEQFQVIEKTAVLSKSDKIGTRYGKLNCTKLFNKNFLFRFSRQIAIPL